MVGTAFTASSDRQIAIARVGLAPAVRWYFAEPLTGPWLGVAVPVSARLGSNGLTRDTAAVSLSLDVLLGWAARLGSTFSLSLGAGPTAWLTTFGVGNDGVGLKATLSVGLLR